MENATDFYATGFWYLIGLVIALITVTYNFFLRNQEQKIKILKQEISNSISSSLNKRTDDLEKKINDLEDEITSLKRHNKKDNEITQNLMEELITKLDKKQPDIFNEFI